MDSPADDGPPPEPEVGHFGFDVASGTWTWSEGFFAIHGYQPGEVPATSGVLLRHKHPDDREQAASVLQKTLATGGPFSNYHRIVDSSGRVRSVLSVGHGLLDEDGQVVRVEGFIVDLTDARRTETQTDVRSALAGIAEHRAVIDQAKGMVMLETGGDGEAAFAHLRACSSRANMKLHEVARLLVQVMETGERGNGGALDALAGIVASARRDASPTAR